ncbi:unnamed protein product [Parnassius mnemosyne]|uniref:Uncharacterized protein n=1 Tax=Parnassius mnemosyne TaxID=213953 RepID=A0AAV1KWN7_9NEOP
MGETAGSCRLTTSAASPAPKTDAHPTRLIFSLFGKIILQRTDVSYYKTVHSSYFLTILINRIPKSKLYYI